MNLTESILEKSGQYKNYTAANLSRLIKCKSFSTKEEKAVRELKYQMEEAGFDEIKVDGLGNVIGRIGTGKKIIAIDGHIDVVNIGNKDNWTFEPFSGEIKDGFVYGRGSVDQKGGVASFVTAGRILKELGFENDATVYFIGSVIEEDCEGLCWKYIIEENKINPDCVILTEPTNLNIYRGQRGRIEMEVSFYGISAHGSAPERGKNAIYMASKAALEIEKLNEHLTFDPFLGKGSVTVTEIISSGSSLCAIPDFAKIHLDRRLTCGEDKLVAVKQIEEIVKDMKAKVETLEYNEKAFTGLKYGMEKYYPTWRVEEDHPVVQKGIKTYKELFGVNPLVDKWTFSTNGAVINGIYGIPVIGFGPGNEVFAHAPDEKLPIDDLVKASAFYAMFCWLI
jgi:putative selenium metabolism hydrolase